MENMKSMMARLVREEDGAAASEYAILVAFIAVAVAAAVKLFNLGDIFTGLGTKVKGLVDGAA
jgi:Flp pilus assembly pilin Flp